MGGINGSHPSVSRNVFTPATYSQYGVSREQCASWMAQIYLTNSTGRRSAPRPGHPAHASLAG
eukprot:5285435-Prymnesium_polylepis.1